jgi:DNA-directed RNA polymerase subunit H (RpoH/RPB5)
MIWVCAYYLKKYTFEKNNYPWITITNPVIITVKLDMKC